jgi:ABC-2 type transport system permease protein
MTAIAPAVPARPSLDLGIPFTRSLRVEWRKSVDTRAARWLLMSVILLSAVAVAVPLLRPDDSAQTLPGYLVTVSLAVTLLVPVVSILTLTTEWSQRTVLATFTQEPRRGRVLGAKLCSGLGLAALGGAVGFLLAVGGLALSDMLGRDVTWAIAAAELAGYALFVVLSSLMGMAFAALLHNTAAAIVAYLALPTLMTIVSLALTSVRDWVDTARTFGWMLHGDWSGHLPQILTSIGIWVVLPLAAGLVRTLQREVK